MLWTILTTILAVVFFYLAKAKRDSSGSVRTVQSYGFVIFALIAIILWIIQILRALF
ncbi:MAG: hypothetical protein SVR08_08055 [Spirochaetota bacterium]|nr:hypothetical protein [Spirochaetota bacterium]